MTTMTIMMDRLAVSHPLSFNLTRKQILIQFLQRSFLHRNQLQIEGGLFVDIKTTTNRALAQKALFELTKFRHILARKALFEAT